MKRYEKNLLLALAIALGASFIGIVSGPLLELHGDLLRYAYAAITLVGGLAFFREVGLAVSDIFRPQLRRNSPVLGNAISLCGSILSALLAAAFAPISPTELLASAALVGVVLGLALQPTLGSFFAGLLILASGAVRPGTMVRIVSWHIPFQGAMFPGYKYFSPDSIYAGYIGEVLHVGLFFTALCTEEGQMMKVPNTILATDAAILEYTDRDFIFNVRYEFSVKFDPDEVLKRVRSELEDYPILSVRVNEQSDKQFYFVKIVLNAKEKDHAALKSEVLSKLVRIQRQLEEENAK